jgi:hypothetical protein
LVTEKRRSTEAKLLIDPPTHPILDKYKVKETGRKGIQGRS